MITTLQLGVSLGIVVAVGAYVYYQQQGINYYYPSILFAILAVNNYQTLQAYRGQGGGGYY